MRSTLATSLALDAVDSAASLALEATCLTAPDKVEAPLTIFAAVALLIPAAMAPTSPASINCAVS